MTEPVVTCVVRARDSAGWIGPLLERLSLLADDLVVLLDSRSTDSTEQIAQAFATVHQIEFDDQGIESLRSMVHVSTSDWILYIDCDEWLDESWSRDALRELTADRYATMYWFPRRWIVPPGDRYLSIAPWHPDWQPRLFRNLPTIYRVPEKVHDAAVVAGESRFIPTLPILHNKFLVRDRAACERTVEMYLALNPGNDCARQFLYESSYHETVPLTKRYARVDRSGIATVDAPHVADVRILDAASMMRAGERYPVYCSIANRSNRTMTAQSEFLWIADTFVTEHWFRADDPARTPYSFGGARHKLPRTIAPGCETAALIEVSSPVESGDYLLQIDLFEENVAWFSRAAEHGSHEMVHVRVV